MSRHLCAALLLLAAGVAVSPALVGPVLAAPSLASEAAGGIPGPRTCFWFRPPVGGDPYVNVAYPDAAARYWTTVFTTPPGAHLTLRGEFPHARYMSFISYDATGKPIEALADYRIKPQAGSTNPFIVGAPRDGARRAYAVDIVDAAPAAVQVEGQTLAGADQNLLHSPAGALFRQQVLVMRVYVPDQGRDILGGARLPEPELTLANGTKLTGQAACDVLNTTQTPVLSPAALALPLDDFAKLARQPDRPAHWPATNPLSWYVQYDRKFLLGIYTGEKPAGARKSEGGFFPNPDNNYIRTIVNRGWGHVLVLRGRMPTTPKTLAGEPVMSAGQLRYWSICSNQGFANTRVNACVHDENVPVAPKGYYTLVVSRAADRPRNAIKECGVTWLPMADDGDGALDPDMTVLQMRNMLGTRDFAHSVQAIPKPGQEAVTMAEYFPKGTYMTTSAFEAGVPCLIEKRP